MTLAAQRRQTLTRCPTWWTLDWAVPYLWTVTWYGQVRTITVVPWSLN